MNGARDEVLAGTALSGDEHRQVVPLKALDLIGSVLGMRRARAIVRAMASLETIQDITSLRRLWRPATVANRGRA